MWPRPPRKLAPPMMTAAMRVELEQVAVERRAGAGAAGEHDGADAGAEPGDDVGRDEHPLDRDAHLDRGLRVAADRIDPAAPDHRLGHDEEDERHGEHDEEGVRQPERRGLAEPGDRVGHAAHRRVVDRELEREAPADAERRERDDEGVRQAPEDIDHAVDRADRGAGWRASRAMTSGAEFDLPVDQPADDRRERQVGADREVDAAGQDHQLLAHRHDGDDRGLGDDVAEVAGLQEVRGPEADADHEQHEDQQGPDARGASGRGRPGSRPRVGRSSFRTSGSTSSVSSPMTPRHDPVAPVPYA